LIYLKKNTFLLKVYLIEKKMISVLCFFYCRLQENLKEKKAIYQATSERQANDKRTTSEQQANNVLFRQLCAIGVDTSS